MKEVKIIEDIIKLQCFIKICSELKLSHGIPEHIIVRDNAVQILSAVKAREDEDVAKGGMYLATMLGSALAGILFPPILLPAAGTALSAAIGGMHHGVSLNAKNKNDIFYKNCLNIFNFYDLKTNGAGCALIRYGDNEAIRKHNTEYIRNNRYEFCKKVCYVYFNLAKQNRDNADKFFDEILKEVRDIKALNDFQEFILCTMILEIDKKLETK